MSWNQLVLASDASIGALEPQAIAAQSPWGQQTWPEQIDAAKADLEIWIERDHPDPPGAADRVRDRWSPDYAWALTGGNYTDETSDVSSDTEEDLDIAAALATPNTDRIYIGALYEFDGLFVHLLDSVNAATSTLTVNYWGRNQWTALEVHDDTIASSGVTLGRTGRIMWRVPRGWERRRLNGTADEYYWVELMVDNALTAGTAATQILPVRPPKGLRRVATYLALGHILNGLALQSPDPERWQTKADGYMEEAKGLYASIRIPLDTDQSGAVEDDETQTLTQDTLRLLRG